MDGFIKYLQYGTSFVGVLFLVSQVLKSIH